MIEREKYSEIYKSRADEISERNNQIFMNEVRRYFSEERILSEIEKSLENNDDRVYIRFKFNKSLDRVYSPMDKIVEHIISMFSPKLRNNVIHISEKENVNDYHMITRDYYYELFFRFS